MNDYLNREIDLQSLLPPTVSDLKEMQEITRVENTHFNKVRLNLIDIFKTRFIHESDQMGVALWEKMLKLKRRSTDTLEDRKFRIIAKINNKLPYTMRSLKQLLNSLCGENNYSVFLYPEDFELHFEFYTKINGVLDLKNTLEAMIPLNIWLHFVYAMKVPPIKIGAREHVYSVSYPITNIAMSNKDDVGFVGVSNLETPVVEKKYEVNYPITGMAFSY